MRRELVVLVVLMLLLISILMGCFGDPGDDDDDKKESKKPPLADAGPDQEVLTMTPIQFNGSNSSDPDGEIVSYAWDFGVQTDTSVEANPKYTYNYPGVYTVTLKVIDDKELNATDTLTVTVNNRNPIIQMEAEAAANVFELIDFNIAALDPDGYLTSFKWDFDGDQTIDWTSSTMIPTTHFYETAGIYNATLKVMDNYNGVTSATRKITIIEPTNAPPVANAGLNQSVHSGQVLLKGTGFDLDGAITKYEWDFDGDDVFDWSSTSTGIVNHDYTTEGEFNAKFRATDDLGSSTTDMVTIKVNNSHIVNNVTATIILTWLTGLDYLVLLNNPINTSELQVVITDITTGQKEEFGSSSLTMIDQTRYSFSSMLIPMPKHSIDIQVFYYGALIGARILEIINENHEVIGPGFDYNAVYSWDHLMEEHDRNGVEKLSVKSIGNIEVKHNNDLYYYSLHGTGEYYMEDTSGGSQLELSVNCTSLWINVTIKDTKILSKSVSILGYGSLSYSFQTMLDLDITLSKVSTKIENNYIIQNYMNGKGTFSGITIDPSSGDVIPIAGDASFISELLGFGFHKNLAGDDYPCGIERSIITLEGMTVIPESETNFPIKIGIINTTWIVDPDSFSNNVIYYEYSTVINMAGTELKDSGSALPQNSPKPLTSTVHISEALSFNLPRPRAFLAGDMMAYATETDVILQLMIEPGAGVTINDKDHPTVVLNGTVTGSASGYFKITVISSGELLGLAVHTIEDLTWNEERLTAEVSLISFEG